MTTNDATPREAIARAMTSGFSQKVWDGEFNPSTDLGYNRAVRGHVRNDFLADADSVIAHLWREAMKPEVTSAAMLAHHNYLRHPDRLVDGFDNAVFLSAVTHAVLTALLGPNPNEQENSDVNR